MWSAAHHEEMPPLAPLAALTAVAAETAQAVSLWPIVGSVIVAVLALAGAVWAGATTLRASSANNLTQIAKYANDRDAQHDQRIEAENVRLRAENDQLRERETQRSADLRELQERHARLRVGVIAIGLDPDEITAPRPAPPTT